MFGDVISDTVAARVQSEVAKFLGLKQTILGLQRNSDLNLQNKANQLYQKQLSLEGQLTDILQRITNMQAGSYTISDITTVGLFANNMEQQIKDVNALSKGQASTLPVSTPLLVGSLAFVGLAFAYYRMGGRR